MTVTFSKFFLFTAEKVKQTVEFDEKEVNGRACFEGVE